VIRAAKNAEFLAAGIIDRVGQPVRNETPSQAGSLRQRNERRLTAREVLDMAICILIAQGLLELFGIGGFLVGYFSDTWWIMVAGGLVMVLDDIFQMQIGILNPFLPVVFAIVLAIIIDPWYVGIFWSLVCFKFLDIPSAVVKVFMPHKAAEGALKHMHERSGS
jgi:hypothetical protein